ncbi:MAG: hypothetical protein R2861_17930, partial [Desulfobacterales bacterium]
MFGWLKGYLPPKVTNNGARNSDLRLKYSQFAKTGSSALPPEPKRGGTNECERVNRRPPLLVLKIDGGHIGKVLQSASYMQMKPLLVLSVLLIQVSNPDGYPLKH